MFINLKKEETSSTSKVKLNVQPKPTTSQIKKVFDDDDEEEDNQKGDKPKTKVKLSRQQRIAQEEATKLDASIFEYDQVYDLMKSAEKKIQLDKQNQGAQRKPQYISGLIETAKQRKIDRVRAEDKMVQREREAEGEEFVNKDEFVTPAYLQQQKELREAEEAEKLKQETIPKKETMTKFYQNILEEKSKRHEAAVNAVNSTSLERSFKIEKKNQSQYDPEPESVPSETKLALQIEQKLGKKIDLDDEGKIVDHRQLLTGGLNLGPPKLGGNSKPKKNGFALPISERLKSSNNNDDDNNNDTHNKDDEEEEERLNQIEKLKLSRKRQSDLIQEQIINLEISKNKKLVLDNLNKSKSDSNKRRNDLDKIQLLKQQALSRRLQRSQN